MTTTQHPQPIPPEEPDAVIRVLVLDDSAFARKVLTHILNSSPFIEVVATAADGPSALKLIPEVQPDVILVDLIMPGMDGAEFIQQLMKKHPLPVVVCTCAEMDSDLARAALEAGAMEFVQKPTVHPSPKLYEIEQELIHKVRLVAAYPKEHFLRLIQNHQAVYSFHSSGQQTYLQGVVIGVSTGGPQALRFLIPALGPDFPLPIAIAIHMPEGFTGWFAESLSQLTSLEVVEADNNLPMQPGRVILAKAGWHLYLQRKGTQVVCRLDLEPADSLHRPSVDVLFSSAAQVYGPRLVAVVMTGIGTDGLEGARAVKRHGGLILTESEESCVVFGMPRAVQEAGLSDLVLPLQKLPEALHQLAQKSAPPLLPLNLST